MSFDSTMVTAADRPPPIARSRPAGVARWLSTNNPFYVISAALVMIGLRMSFDTSAEGFAPIALMIGLSLYCVALAGTAVWVIRRCQVWDDARMILLLFVLVTLAVSVTFDDLLASRPAVGAIFFVVGWLLTLGLNELVLRGARLTLPAAFRIPYYLLVTHFFLYPVMTVRLLAWPTGVWRHGVLLLFPVIAAVLFLPLVAAVGREPRHTAAGGCPWRRPWYPWILFAILAFAACVRTVYLCMSFDSIEVFAPWFLSPILLAGAVLAMQVAVVTRHHVARWLAFTVPMLPIVLAGMPSEHPVAVQFAASVESLLGMSLAKVSLALAVGIYVSGCARGVRGSWEALATCLAVASVGRPLLAEPAAPEFLLAGSLIFILRGCGMRDLRRVFAGCVTAIFAGTVVGDHAPWCWFVAGHLLIVSAMVIGAVSDDRFGRVLQAISMVGLSGAAIASQSHSGVILPAWWGTAYMPCAIGVACVYGFAVRSPLVIYFGLLAAAIWSVAASVFAYTWLRYQMVGLDFVLGGVASLVIALWITRRKGRLPPVVPGERSAA